ncbi:MAG: hypothetical protein KAT70_02510, partial [Thermoplasmata archaeon]|nr:hypothetical protein [Thermoplasmata archaeon]
MTEEASYKCVIGSQTFETDTDKTLLDYNIQFEDNHPAECWVEIEDEYAKLVEANQLLVFHIVPWQGTTLGQFFYGMVYDKWVSGPNQMRILAKCALEQGEHLEVDMIFAHTIHDNEEFDIDEGATSNDPPRANLGVPYTDVVKPITRVQCALYPENYKRPEAPLMTTGTTISLGNGRKFIATRFVPETDRYIFLGFYGTSDANYDVGIYEESEYGFPDFSKLVYEQPNKFPRPAGGYHGVELLFHPTEFLLSVGIPYWIIVSPNNLINPYDFTFYSDPFINSKGITGLGVAINSDGQNSGWAWSGPTKDEIGIMSITPILWKTVREHLDWELINDSGTGVIEFGGIEKFIPDWVTSFTANRMGCRVFFFEDQLDAWWIYATLGLNIMGSYVNAPAGVLYVPFVDAMESKVNDILRGVSDAHGWHFRQYHRDEGVNWYEKPPVLRAEPLPSFGSPVLDLKHGDDATDVTTQARIVSDSLKKQVTRAFTGVDMMANDAQG